MPIFTDENIEKLFGAEDAENELEDRFKQYFFYNKAYDNLTSALPLRILVGHKGVGKSALLKRAYLSDVEKNILSIALKPNEILAITAPKDVKDFYHLVEHWKQGILAVLASRLLGSAAQDIVTNDTVAGFASKISSFISAISSKITQVANEKISNDFSQAVVDQFAKTGIIHVYIDDIDRGWAATQDDIRNISALLNAMRDISGSDQRVRFRIGLRSDVYFLVRTSDESTDKIGRNIIWLSWTNHEILCVMAKRIQTFFGDDQSQESILKLNQTDISKNILSKIIQPVFEGVGHWSKRPIHNVLLSLTRARPRDLVKLMHGAARRAFAGDSNIITSKNLEDSFSSYSNERLQDIINEFRSEMPEIERLLLAMKPSKKSRTTSENFLFSGDRLSSKISDIMQNVNIKFTNGKPATGKAIIQFLYKIDFITARKELENGIIDRKYFDHNHFLANEFSDFGYSWEIHPAYRWALAPQDIQSVIDSLKNE